MMKEAKNDTQLISKHSVDKNELASSRTTDEKISDVKLSMSLSALGQSRNVSSKKEGAKLSNIVANSLDYLKKMLGLTPDCLNGGTKTLRSECVCPKFYQGPLCEEPICANNGTLVKVPKVTPTQYSCKCPHPEYIHGAHCESVKCLNGGQPMPNGHCKCLDNWYTGQFCQDYTSSWGAMFALPMSCVMVVLVCCVVCRFNWFRRKPVYLSRRRRLSACGIDCEVCRRAEMRLTHSRRHNERHLLHENSNAVPRSDNRILSPCVIELNTLPTSSAGEHSPKPFDPPPPYEEVMAASQQTINRISIDATILPPAYSPPFPSPGSTSSHFPPPYIPRSNTT